MTAPRRLRIVPPQGEPPVAAELADLVQRLDVVQRALAEIIAALERLDGPLAAPDAEPPPRWRPVKWLAYELHRSPKTIIRWAQAAGAARRLAGRWLVDSDLLGRWLAARGRSRRR